jgi:hydrogenase maturation protease
MEGKLPENILILGVGNIILGDEGFGVHVIRRLRDSRLPDNVRLEEGGVGGFDLLGSLEGVDRVIVIDIMAADLPPGEIRFFKPGPGFGEPGKRTISFHQVGVLELVQMWGLLGHQPEIYYLVTRPLTLDWRTELSPPVQGAAAKAVKLIEEMSADNFASLERSYGLCT